MFVLLMIVICLEESCKNKFNPLFYGGWIAFWFWCCNFRRDISNQFHTEIASEISCLPQWPDIVLIAVCAVTTAIIKWNEEGTVKPQ